MTYKSRAAMSLQSVKCYKLIKPMFTVNKTICIDSEFKFICKPLASLELFLSLCYMGFYFRGTQSILDCSHNNCIV